LAKKNSSSWTMWFEATNILHGKQKIIVIWYSVSDVWCKIWWIYSLLKTFPQQDVGLGREESLWNFWYKFLKQKTFLLN